MFFSIRYKFCFVSVELDCYCVKIYIVIYWDVIWCRIYIYLVIILDLWVLYVGIELG